MFSQRAGELQADEIKLSKAKKREIVHEWRTQTIENLSSESVRLKLKLNFRLFEKSQLRAG